MASSDTIMPSELSNELTQAIDRGEKTSQDLVIESDVTLAIPRKPQPTSDDATMQWEDASEEGLSSESLYSDETDFSLDGAVRPTDPKVSGDATVEWSRGDDATGQNRQAPKQVSEKSETEDFIPGYELLSELGRGGMGVVYKARQRRLNRVVALKMVLSGGHASQSELARFLTEAESVAQLHHPNIVQIYEMGRHDGLPYFTLEYMEGGSLADRVKEHPLPAREAARIVEAMARAMAYAHERGIIHRDLKPDNVLFAADGTPKITDFGLAKKIEGGSGMTHTGAIMGTPSYMAPEQADGRTKNVGPAADIYSLGAVLYRLITGRPPFQAATPVETVLMVVRDEPVPPRRLLPRLPKDLETICLKCLQKEPGRRYPTATELADDLARFLNDEPVRARPVRPWERWIRWARHHPSTVGLVLVACLALLGGLGFLVHSHLESQRQREAAREQVIAQLQAGKEAMARGDWKSAEVQLVQAHDVLQTQPTLKEEFPEAETMLGSVRDRLRALQIHTKFRQLRDEALLQAARSSGNGSPTQQAATLKKIETALKAVMVDPQATEPLVLPSGFEPSESKEISASCYELLLAMAEAHAQPILGQSPEAYAQQLRESLRLLDRAAALECPDHPTEAFFLRKARYQKMLGGGETPSTTENSLSTTAPRSTLDHYLLGDEFYKLGEIARAITAFEAVLRADPRHFWARYFLALCQLRSSQPDLARAHLTACLAQNPDVLTRAWILLMRGYASGQMARTSTDAPTAKAHADDAERDFQTALDVVDGGDPEAHLEVRYALYNNRGVMRVQMGRVDDGLADLRRAIDIDPTQYPARVSLALALQQQHRVREALDELSRAIDTARSLQTRGEVDAATLAGLFRQRSQVSLEDWQNQLCQTIASAVGLFADSIGTLSSLAIWATSDDRRCDEALADLEQAHRLLLESSPNDVTPRVRILLQMGRLHQYRARHLEALRTFDQIIELTPNSTEALRRRAVSRLKLGRLFEAEKGFTEYIQECQKQGIRATVESYLARAYARERLGRWDDAIEDFSQALALESGDQRFNTRQRRGRLYLATNKYQFALADFDAVIGAGRANVDTYLGRALANAHLGLFQKALQDAESALASGLDTATRQLALARVLALLVAAAETGQFRWSADEAYAEALRALDLIEQALQTAGQPAELFWRDHVRADSSLQPLRRAPRFGAWELKWSRMLLESADRIWANESSSTADDLEAARTFAQFAEYPPPESISRGRRPEEFRTLAENLVRRAINRLPESERFRFWVEIVEADHCLIPLKSQQFWSELRQQVGFSP
jgi:serine/threonine protein kinase/Tfp pilus assembly protein PilF